VRNGAIEIIPVGDVELADQLKEENSDCVLMGAGFVESILQIN
jgi:hypothetical protein